MIYIQLTNHDGKMLLFPVIKDNLPILMPKVALDKPGTYIILPLGKKIHVQESPTDVLTGIKYALNGGNHENNDISKQE